MLPASLYTPLYQHAMLLVVFGCALFYWMRQGQARSLTQPNQVAMIAIGVGVLLFMGFRPVSGVFVDMTIYAEAYQRLQNGVEVGFGDRLFDGLMRLCAPFLPVGGFFFVCALIYIAPLAVASWRVHGAWAFPVFLACVTAFSFWAYGVNGIRNGMATSVLILAFAFHDKPVVMFPLMAAAWGFHGSVLLPAGAFLLVRYFRRTEIWLAFWAMCVVATLMGGNVGGMLMARYSPFASDDRVERYIVNAEGGGFRADFLAYSIIPVVVTLLLAAPSCARARRFVARVGSRAGLHWMRKRSGLIAGMGKERLAGLQGTIPVGNLALAEFGPISGDPRSGQGATPSTLPSSVGPLRMDNPSSRRNPMLADLASQSQAAADLSRRSQTEVDLLPVLRSFSKGGLVAPESDGGGLVTPKPGDGGSTRERSNASSGQAGAALRARVKQNGWNSLPWVRLLRSDPLYARLVNTYLLTNAVWVLLIHANFSNRFAYLSWFMMPWVLLYPFVPGKIIQRPRTGLIAAILCAQYLFTYFMMVVVHPLRERL